MARELMIQKGSFKWEHDPLLYHSCGLTGYTGTNPHSVMQMHLLPAFRTQIGRRGLYKGALAQLPNGNLVVTPCATLEAIHIFVSSDGGYTWKEIEHTPLFGKEPGLTCLKNGALLLTLENQKGTVAFSDNGACNWHVTHMKELLPDLPDTGWLATVRSPIEHADGTVTLLRCWGHWECAPKDSPRSRVWLFHSHDNGKTWTDREEIGTWEDSYSLFQESDFLRLPDNRILATSRFEYDHPIFGTNPPWLPKSVRNDHAAGHMVLLESSDDMRTWSLPRDFLNYSEVHGQLTLLNDGRILCTYTNYHLPFGVAAVLSDDMGKTWNTEHPFQLAISNGIGTGWPTTRQLSDGALLTVYALEPYHLEPKEKGTVVFQCIRWKVP